MTLQSTRQHTIFTSMLMQLILVFWISGTTGSGDTFDGTLGRMLLSDYVFDKLTVRSRMDCLARCGVTVGCASVSFEPATSVCMLSFLLTVDIQLQTDINVGWDTYSRDDWLLVFRAPKGIEGDVYLSYVNGVDVTTNSVDCTDLASTNCQTNNRHTVLDIWDMADIEQVRFSFYKNQVEVAYVVFNASGSNLTSWFAKERIIDSTWPTSGTDSYDAFSLDGSTISGESVDSRRFSMHVDRTGCDNDLLYSVAIVNNSRACNFDHHVTYPQFIYASTTSPGYPNSQSGTDVADFVAIFVKS